MWLSPFKTFALERSSIVKCWFQLAQGSVEVMYSMRMIILLGLISIFFLPLTYTNALDIFTELEEEMLSAKGKQAVLELSEILTKNIEDRPKEIEITCPGNISPTVTIRDLVTESASAFDGGKCMVLKSFKSLCDFKCFHIFHASQEHIWRQTNDCHVVFIGFGARRET